ALLGFLCQASGIATQSARFKSKAKEKTLISFGARRMHPSISPMIERNAYIGGCDGVATVKSACLLGETPMGTMPHSLILCFNSTVLALSAFDDVIEKEVPRITLIDTFQDEKFEALYVAEFLKEKLYGVRLDTPPSRRGNFKKIIEEVRWELNLRGYKDIKIFVSGGLKEEDVEELYPLVDGFGVGTSISNAPVIDFSLDIVEIEGNPFSKKGKLSGKKDLLFCKNCSKREIIPFKESENFCPCGRKRERVLKKILSKGEVLEKLPSPKEIRNRVLKNILK
ncbi:MAG: nicotinate phosphoribosyltransferase, partial [Thermoanaerobaculia bacterium]